MSKRALISVSDKEGVQELGRGLSSLGFEILSTGGTASTLEAAGLKVTKVSDVTGFPEMLDGRVKTLHPAIHGGLLARGIPEHLDEIKRHGIIPIDLLAVNLYPFRETISKAGVTFDEAIEQIDIGGPAMIRSSAKNHERVIVLVNPDQYIPIIEMLKTNGEVPLEIRRELAAQAFIHTAEYDACISDYLIRETGYIVSKR